MGGERLILKPSLVRRIRMDQPIYQYGNGIRLPPTAVHRIKNQGGKGLRMKPNVVRRPQGGGSLVMKPSFVRRPQGGKGRRKTYMVKVRKQRGGFFFIPIAIAGGIAAAAAKAAAAAAAIGGAVGIGKAVATGVITGAAGFAANKALTAASK